MRKKILSMFLVLCMSVGFIPVFTLPSSAADFGSGTTTRTTTLDLTGIATDSSNPSEGWSWVYSTKTLTLNGADIQVSNAGSSDSYGIKLPQNSTITLADGSINTVKSADVSDNKTSYGIFFAAPQEVSTNTINGTGTLYATGGSATGSYGFSFGICTQAAGWWGTINIKSGTIYAAGGTSAYYSCGIAAGLAITISGGTSIVTGGISKYSYGISTYNGDVTISGGAVTVTGGSSVNDSYGIQACLGINISGGTITATGGSSTNGSSHGLNAFNNDLIITGGTVTATGGSAATASYGIIAQGYVSSKIQFDGGICIARSGAATTSNAVKALITNSVTFTGTIPVAGGLNTNYAVIAPTTSALATNAARTAALDLTSSGLSYKATDNTDKTGVNPATTSITDSKEGWNWAYDTKILTLNSANIKAESGEGKSTGIELPAGSTIVLADGSVNIIKSADVTGAGNNSYGIFCPGGVTVDGNGKLFSTAGRSEYYSSGIYSTGSITIGVSGSPDVIATGGTSQNTSCGIYFTGNLTIGGSGSPAVTAIGGTAANASYGICNLSDFGDAIFDGGTTYAYSGTSIQSSAVTSPSVKFGTPVAKTGIISPAGAGMSSDKKYIATLLGGTTAAANVLIKPIIYGTPTIAVTNGYGTGCDQIKIGAALTVTPNTTPGTDLSYQWEVSPNGTSDWTNATGLGNSTAAYTVDAADVIRYLRVKITSADAPGTVYSAISAQVPYTITLSKSGDSGTDDAYFGSTGTLTAYSVSGSAIIGFVLNGTGTKSNSVTYSPDSIKAVTAAGSGTSSYTINGMDAVSGVITITTAFSHTNHPALTGTPTIAVTNGNGTGFDQIKIGAVLTAASNTTPNTNLSYQWEVSQNGTSGWTNATGSGNTTAVYTVAGADAAKYLRIKVTSTIATGVVYSAASAQVPYSNAQAPEFDKNLSGDKTYSKGDTATALSVNASVADSGTVTYQWYENSTFATSGTAIDGATTATYTPKTDKTGVYYYYSVAKNTNNAVSDNKTALSASNIVKVTVNNLEVLAPVISNDTPKTTMQSEPNIIEQAVLTTADKDKLATGSNISIYLKVENIAASQADKSLVLSALGGKTVGQYLDISLIKNIDGTETKVTDTSSPIRITIAVPENLRASLRTFAIVRVHDGVATTLADLDNDPNTITIETDRFSTFAIAYWDAGSMPVKNPDTGDHSPVIFYALLVTASLSLVFFAAKKRRFRVIAKK